MNLKYPNARSLDLLPVIDGKRRNSEEARYGEQKVKEHCKTCVLFGNGVHVNRDLRTSITRASTQYSRIGPRLIPTEVSY
jgi:hypothetical protein